MDRSSSFIFTRMAAKIAERSRHPWSDLAKLQINSTDDLHRELTRFHVTLGSHELELVFQSFNSSSGFKSKDFATALYPPVGEVPEPLPVKRQGIPLGSPRRPRTPRLPPSHLASSLSSSTIESNHISDNIVVSIPKSSLKFSLRSSLLKQPRVCLHQPPAPPPLQKAQFNSSFARKTIALPLKSSRITLVVFWIVEIT